MCSAPHHLREALRCTGRPRRSVCGQGGTAWPSPDSTSPQDVRTKERQEPVGPNVPGPTVSGRQPLRPAKGQEATCRALLKGGRHPVNIGA